MVDQIKLQALRTLAEPEFKVLSNDEYATLLSNKRFIEDTKKALLATGLFQDAGVEDVAGAIVKLQEFIPKENTGELS